MCGWNHWNLVLGNIDPVAQTGAGDVRKAFANKFWRLVGNVQVDAARSSTLHFGVDGSGNNIAGSEFAAGIVAVHKAVTFFVYEDRALASNRLRNQEGTRFGMIQAGGMKLDELHVGDARASSPGHRQPVSRGNGRICRVEINFTAAAGGQHNAIAAQSEDLAACLVEHVNAKGTVLAGETEFAQRDQIHRHVMFQHVDPGMLFKGSHQCALDFLSGDISRVKDAPLGVAAFLGEIQFGGAVYFAIRVFFA